VLVHLRFPGQDGSAELEELQQLAASAGAHACATIIGRREAPDAATYAGKGKVEEIRAEVCRTHAALVLFNHELSPAQERNLEKVLGCRVLDRTGLILDIFAQRARSHEGKLQVELAQLERLSTRLVRGWTHLERQKGGIGLRGGPGETQLEVDRRLVRERIKKLNDRLRQVSQARRSRRRARDRVPIPTVSLVGYTNAGKSSLFNRLTGSAVYAADQLFATLDPTMRRLQLPGHADVILADTVGFIRSLPHGLVEAFKSTLEEVADAELLLHVVDASHGERREQIEQVNRVLSEIEADQVPQIMVFNKIDLRGEKARCERDARGRIHRVWLSAQTGEGVDLLVEALSDFFRRERVRLQLRLPPAAGRLRARIFARAAVLNESALPEGGWAMTLELDGAAEAWLRQQPEIEPGMLYPEQPQTLARTGS